MRNNDEYCRECRSVGSNVSRPRVKEFKQLFLTYKIQLNLLLFILCTTCTYVCAYHVRLIYYFITLYLFIYLFIDINE